jgi:hypothetical protein
MDDYVHGRGKYAKDGPGDFCDVSFDYYVWREWYGIAGSWNGSTGEADHIIDADEWREYLGGVIAQAHDASDDSLILTAGLFDTRIVDDGTPYNVWADTPHDTYYIEPLDIYVKGHELNYIGQGMLYASKGLPKETTVLLPAAWKMANIFSDYVNPDEHVYSMPTHLEYAFTAYGFVTYMAATGRATVSPSPAPREGPLGGVHW